MDIFGILDPDPLLLRSMTKTIRIQKTPESRSETLLIHLATGTYILFSFGFRLHLLVSKLQLIVPLKIEYASAASPDPPPCL